MFYTAQAVPWYLDVLQTAELHLPSARPKTLSQLKCQTYIRLMCAEDLIASQETQRNLSTRLLKASNRFMFRQCRTSGQPGTSATRRWAEQILVVLFTSANKLTLQQHLHLMSLGPLLVLLWQFACCPLLPLTNLAALSSHAVRNFPRLSRGHYAGALSLERRSKSPSQTLGLLC